MTEKSKSSNSKRGTLRFRFYSPDNITINELTFVIRKKINQPEGQWERAPFFPMVQKVQKPTLPVNENSNVYQGFLHSNKLYSFELEEGDYYGSIITNDWESAYTLKRIRPLLFNDFIHTFITIGYEASITHQTSLEDIKFTIFTFDACRMYSELKQGIHWACPKISIRENEITELNVSVSKRDISLIKTFFTWIPGIVLLVPVYSGAIVYERNTKVSLNFRDRLNDKQNE